MIDRLSYIAGFIDGEGCITIVKSNKGIKIGGKNMNFFPMIIIVNTNKEILEWINEFFSGIGNLHCYKAKHNTNRKDCFRLQYTNQKALIVAKLINDYLIIKKEQCQIAIELYEKVIENNQKRANNLLCSDEINRREYLFQKITKLNKKGRNENNNN